MAFEIALAAVKPVTDGVWSARLNPSDVKRLGEAQRMSGNKSVIGVLSPIYSSELQRLFIEPAKTTVFNVGDTDAVLVVDLGVDSAPSGRHQPDVYKAAAVPTVNNGDAAFLAACKREKLPLHLIEAAEKIIDAIRTKFAGHMREGKARKWVNYPDNFLALVIQPRDCSFAVHVWGRPNKFSAASLEIKPDRSRYSRFKLSRASQLDDTIRIILESARLCTGH